MTIPANTAAQILLICSGEYSRLTRYTVTPLIIIMKRPRVSNIAGNEKIIRIGLMMILMTASSRPAMIRARALSKLILVCRKPAAIHNPILQTSHLIRNLTNG
jgi:hypothetical protein